MTRPPHAPHESASQEVAARPATHIQRGGARGSAGGAQNEASEQATARGVHRAMTDGRGTKGTGSVRDCHGQ